MTEEDAFDFLMIRVGIIGTIGSGKSFISKLFKRPVFSADREVIYLYKNNKKCFRKLKSKMPEFVNKFPIKKKQLIKAISVNKNNLNKIASVVHPLVRDKMRVFLKKNQNEDMVILDIPLLIENKLNKKKDILIYVKSDKKKIIRRLKKRPNFNEKVLRRLKENQSLISKKKRLADYIVDNNDSIKVMKKKIRFIKNKILHERNNT